MKKLLVFCCCLNIFMACGKKISVESPDSELKVTVQVAKTPVYSITYKGEVVLEPAPLGLYTSIGDFSNNLKFESCILQPIVDVYHLNRSKMSDIGVNANKLTATFTNANADSIQMIFFVENNNVALCYRISSPTHHSCEITGEATAFDFPLNTKTIITPQAPWGAGWKLSKPSYEEEYTYFEPIGTPSKYGLGYTFPALFQTNEKTWTLISETGVDGQYVGCKLGEGTAEGVYPIAFPEKEENRSIGTNTVFVQLPAQTSWKTITIGETLAPIVESTIAFDVVKPKFESPKEFLTGRSTWSWILWQDESCNYNDQKIFIDLAADMKYEYILIDALWDKQIGYDKIPELIKYAQSKGVDVILWYNSNGQWNDAPQGPKNRMDTPEARQKEMEWMQSLGVKGIKVDFFGGDKQCTMQLYEDILTDAAKYGLAVNFHGTTIPRGWERMYPNYMSSEAVLASENLVFQQYFADKEAFSATIIPFTRNAIGNMDFGPVFFSKRFSKHENWGTIRKTTDAFEMATAVLFSSAIQHFGIVPNDLKTQPDDVLEFMKNVPTTWDETKFIDGYPGKYCVIARRHKKTWYIAAVNGENEEKELSINLPMLSGHYVNAYRDDDSGQILRRIWQVSGNGQLKFKLQPYGGVVITD